MGGFYSGRTGGRPTVEAGLTVDFGLMQRGGWFRDGAYTAGNLSWSSHGEQIATIGYRASGSDPDNAWLELSYRNMRDSDWVERKQRIRLSCTVPHFGGRRWRMHCPVNGERVGKLHLPPGGDIFASRTAWRLGYKIQRVASRDKAFERLFRLQRKLGCAEGWQSGIWRPKGMHRTTFERHFDRYLELEEECDRAFASLAARLLSDSRTRS